MKTLQNCVSCWEKTPRLLQGAAVSTPWGLLSRSFLWVTWPRRAFKRDLKENNEGSYEFLQEVYSRMKGSMGEDREAFAAHIRQRYWRLLPWAGEAGVTS